MSRSRHQTSPQTARPVLLRLLGTVAPLLCLQAVPLHAQTADQGTRGAPILLGTIILTATGDTTTKGAMSVEAEALSSTQPDTVGEAVARLPGVIVTRADNALSYGVNIRGFGGSSADANDPKVTYTLDGVGTQGGTAYRNASAQLVDPALIRRIDVTKGTLSSLEYGSGLAGGAVNMETIEARDLIGDGAGFRGRQVLGANSNGNGWLTSTTLAWAPNEQADFLFNYTRRKQDAREDGNGDLIGADNGYNLPSYLLKGNYYFGEGNAHRLSFSWLKSDSDEYNVPLSQFTIGQDMLFGRYDRSRKGSITSVAYGYNPADNDLIDFEVKLSASRQDHSLTGLGVGMLERIFGISYSTDTDSLSAKNTSIFQTGSVAHNLRFGTDASWTERDNALPGVAAAGKAQRLGIFAIDEMSVADDLNITAGARIERQKLSNVTAAMPLPDMSATARSAGIAVEKGLAHGFTGYGSFSYGEGLTALSEAGFQRAVSGDYFGDLTAQSRSWEAGVRYAGQDLLGAGDRLAFSVGLFMTDLWNDQSSTLTAAAPMRDTKGVEASLHYEMAQGFYANAAVTILSKSSQYSITAASWNDYLYTPADQASVTLGYQLQNGLDLSWTLRAAKSLDLALASGNNLEAPGWGTSDVMASYTLQSGSLQGLQIDFGVTNLFDKQYHTQYATPGTTPTLTYAETGRNVHLTLTKNF